MKKRIISYGFSYKTKYELFFRYVLIIPSIYNNNVCIFNILYYYDGVKCLLSFLWKLQS